MQKSVFALSLLMAWGGSLPGLAQTAAAAQKQTATHSAAELKSLCGSGTYRYNLWNQNLNEILENGSQLPLRRLVTAQQTRVPAGQQRQFLQMAPNSLDSQTLSINAQNAAAGARLIVCSHPMPGQNAPVLLDDFTLAAGQGARRKYSGLKDRRLFLKIVNEASTGTAAYQLDWQLPGEGAVWQPDTKANPAPIKGFADIHVHHAGSLAFGGGWYWGSHREGPVALRMPACDGHNHGTVAPFKTGVKLLDAHPPQRFGETAAWPHWKDIKHEQVSAEALKSAHQNGLGLMMASLVNNQWLAGAVLFGNQQVEGVPANDMDSLKLQLHSLWEMHHNTDWYRIVRDPWEARRAAAAGQLPVVLALEVDHLFPEGDGPWKQQLHDFYAMGVRSLQLAHQYNTHFSGAAFHRDIFKPMGYIKALFKPGIGFEAGNGFYNPVGLSPLGYELIDEMVRLNMLIDMSHLSIAAQREIYAYVRDKHQGYPLYNSHTRYGPILTQAGVQELKEFVVTPETAVFYRRTGGMVGLRTGEHPMRDFAPPSGGKQQVANNCDGSSRSLAQIYEAWDAHGLSIALASDFNGFISQAGPRYGPEACPNAPPEQRAAQIAAQGSPPAGSEQLQRFHTQGLAHMDLLPALIEDWRATGLDTRNIDHSAEAFLKMWERAYDPNRTLLP
ncbi:MAG: membrane dipeptidase [Candidatus Sericytochromatia bacterium]|nr:membrane dipeptidase [Candidatus Sericytochromatia bacterium]